MPIYIYIFCTFPEVAIVRCSTKYLFLKYDRKVRAEFLEMLQRLQYIFIMASSLRKSCRRVSVDSSEIVFDEAHFIVHLQSFLQPLALPIHTFPQSEPFVPHSPRQNNFQNSSPLDTSGFEKFQIYEKLQFPEDVLRNQNIDSRYFYSYATTSLHPFPCITPAVSKDRHLEYQVSLYDL